MKRSRALPYLAGAVTALAGTWLFAPRARTAPDPFSGLSGRGQSGIVPAAPSLQAGYDVPDVAAGRIGLVMVLFAAFAMAGVALMVLMLSLLHHRDAAREAGLTREQLAQSPPPLPRLQADPIGELAGLRAAQGARLHAYARLDAHTARIPIERAMALVVGQSLDAHADSAKQP